LSGLGHFHPILATASRAERATSRAARELARREAPGDAMEDGLALNASSMERLTLCHRTSCRTLDWREMAGRKPVALPVRTHEREKAARRALGTWRPSWHDRMFGDEAMRRRQLTEKVIEAARQDEAAFQKIYRAAATYNAEAIMAARLMKLEPQAVKDAIIGKTRLAELREPMNGLWVALPGGRRVVALVEAVHEGDIPYLRVAGSDRKGPVRAPMTPSERRRIHLATVCSAGLRVGAELVAVLPVEAVEVVVNCEPPGSVRAEPQPVMQVLVTARAVAEASWGLDDAVAQATALRARMDWSLEEGFAPIQIVNLTPGGQPTIAAA